MRWNRRDKPAQEIDLSQAPDWDEEAIAEAEHQSRELEAYDPDAASELRSKAAAARHKLTGIVAGREPYDPMRTYARMAKFYRWTHEAMDQMHFVTFFAYVREASEIAREEEDEIERRRRSQGTPQQAQGLFVEAAEYNGETVQL